MDEPHVTFKFEGIPDELGQSNLRIIDHLNGCEFAIQVSVDDKPLLNLRGLQLDSRIADLIDLAVAIHEADRWAKHSRDFPRAILVQLPVRSVDVFKSPELHKHLKQMLFWFTGDAWTFEFTPLEQRRRLAERQLPMWTSSNEDAHPEVALWSGGLDALAGLCNRINQKSAQRFLLVGAGGNPTMRGVQKRVFCSLKERLGTDLVLMQLHIYRRGTGKARLRPNGRFRARGVVFMILGSAYARLEGQNALALYENGPGALNLPYRASEVGLDHTRSVHPLSLHLISQLVQLILDKPFVVHNPFIGCTKAEMCRVLDKMKVTDIAWETLSCDRPHRKDVKQCGRCSSCLLRRQSFLASDAEDCTRYLNHVETGTKRENLLRESHLLHMIYQARSLRDILEADNAWEVLAHKYPTLLGDIPYRLPKNEGQDGYDIAEEIVNVLRRYADEWILPSVLNKFEAEIEDIRRVH